MHKLSNKCDLKINRLTKSLYDNVTVTTYDLYTQSQHRIFAK